MAKDPSVANRVAPAAPRVRSAFRFVSNRPRRSIRYLIFGEGETGLTVYAILLRYWEWTPEEDVRPLIFLMSD
jgi:hypothetical protein